MPTKTDWAQESWNPITGCYGPLGTPEAPRRCPYCYAHRFARRLAGRYGYPEDDPFKPTLHLERLEYPLRWRKPRRVFVCSMGELLGSWVPSLWRRRVMDVIQAAPQHVYIILTKQPRNIPLLHRILTDKRLKLWIGVSITDTERPTERARLEAFMAQPLPEYVVRFVSVEPLLGRATLPPRLDWIIVGAQTGLGARKPDPGWVQEIINFARQRRIPLFLKENLKWPQAIQEWPEAR